MHRKSTRELLLWQWITVNGVNKLLNVSIKVIFFAIHAAGVRIKSAANNYANKKFATVKAFSLMSLWALMLEFLVHFCGPKRRLS